MKTITLNLNGKALMACLFITFIAYTNNCFSQISSQGPNSPTTATETTYGCLACDGSDWLNFQDVEAPDGQYAKTGLAKNQQCFSTNCYYSRALIAQGYGFTVPSDAIISGIKAEVLRKAIVDSISDLRVKLLQNGDTVGTNKARAGFWSITLLVYAPYGDSTDLWGANWSPQLIDSSGFGLSVQVQNSKAAVTDTAYIDHIRITVYYALPTGVMEHQSSDDSFFAYYNAVEQAIIVRGLQLSSPASEIAIYNSLGQQVLTKNLTATNRGSTEKISMLNLPKGIYFAQLLNDSGGWVSRFVKE